MYVSTSEIVQKANSIVAQCGTRDPLRIARDLGIEVMYYPFNEQRGAYKVLMRNRFIFVKNDLHPVTKKFHYPSCSSVKQMSDKNKQTYTGSRDDLISQGYDTCKKCNP